MIDICRFHTAAVNQKFERKKIEMTQVLAIVFHIQRSICHLCLFRFCHFSDEYLRDLQILQREIEQVPATLSQIQNIDMSNMNF